ncbi:hypothetical protein RHMOL_Rhmol08G0030300 [Rhododendron molle]|uniref:Uncharacterized protein n=2 Tax=Rhododendron molle TaxID=49168 RepID=A0ACC0MIZ5_RHOML|nr:hypothetical protein RHMOL_Rhmol08G0030300 [Rhododendron molle]KAI8541019.1 hypothetical protein RHMOL_Rhmol08G0030300 [Rhododendron molle]
MIPHIFQLLAVKFHVLRIDLDSSTPICMGNYFHTIICCVPLNHEFLFDRKGCQRWRPGLRRKWVYEENDNSRESGVRSCKNSMVFSSLPPLLSNGCRTMCNGISLLIFRISYRMEKWESKINERVYNRSISSNTLTSKLNQGSEEDLKRCEFGDDQVAHIMELHFEDHLLGFPFLFFFLGYSFVGYLTMQAPTFIDEKKKERLSLPMDSSSSTSTHGMIPRYRTKYCHCKLQAVIRVTNSDPNRGKLYYSCPNGVCDIWDWCKPMNIAPSVPTQRRVFHEDETENATTGDENARRGVDNAMVARMAVLEGQLGTLKMMVAMCLITIVLCFFVILLK